MLYLHHIKCVLVTDWEVGGDGLGILSFGGTDDKMGHVILGSSFFPFLIFSLAPSPPIHSSIPDAHVSSSLFGTPCLFRAHTWIACTYALTDISNENLH